MYDRCATNLFVSLLLLVHANSGNFLQILTQLPTKHNHLTLTPNHIISLSLSLSLNFPKPVRIHILVTKHYHLLSFTEHYQQCQCIMKFKSDIHASEEKNSTEQQNIDTSIPKMIEPLNVVPPTKPKKKTAFKSTTKKKRTVKNDESKVALSMTDLYVKENPFKASEADTTAQASKNAEYEETSKISPDVVTFSHENGNPDTTLMSDVPESGRKLGLEDLNNAIDSTEYMDMDIPNTGNDTKVDVSVEKDPENSDVQEDVGPDVETSLGQPDNLVDDTAKIVGEKEPSFETAPEKEVNSGNTVVNSHSEVNEESEEDPKENQEEDYSEDKEKDKGVVDVDSLDSDEIPLINTFSESVAKRLRSNKGKVVTSVTRTSKTRTKTAGVGPKKGWSKVKMKTTA